MHYWNAADGGFYECQYHGARTLQIIDPDFEWPTSKVPAPDWQGDPEEAPLIEVRDDDIEPPMIEVPNPETVIPVDAVEISPTLYQQLLDGLSKGKRIEADEYGHPVLVDKPSETLEQIAARKRHELDVARDTAINAGFTYQFDSTEDLVQTRPRDRENINGLAVYAQLLIASGDTTTTLFFRAESDTTYTLTAPEILDLARATQLHISAQYEQAWSFKDQIEKAFNNGDRETLLAINW